MAARLPQLDLKRLAMLAWREPPVYAPEVVSEMILKAAQRPIRELIAGG